MKWLASSQKHKRPRDLGEVPRLAPVWLFYSSTKGFTTMTKTSILTELMSVIAARKASAGAEKSYVASLMKGGLPKITAKISEEAAEVVEAAAETGAAGDEHLVKEVADLVFHAMVLLGSRDLHWNQVESELGRRFGVSGLDEKAARTQKPET